MQASLYNSDFVCGTLVPRTDGDYAADIAADTAAGRLTALVMATGVATAAAMAAECTVGNNPLLDDIAEAFGRTPGDNVLAAALFVAIR